MLCGEIRASENGAGPWIVVLDPGHGGGDPGARSSGGVLEKDISLQMARRVAEVLGDGYRVGLTRTDDYQLDNDRRTAAANHVNADLFVSLHTGGNFQPDVRGMAVYWFEPGAAVDPAHNADESADELWQHAQTGYAETSRKLSQIMQRHLAERFTSVTCRLQGGPMAVLKGAGMPAIVIEFGYLTNALDEQLLSASVHIDDVARAIADGIHEFFSIRE